MSTTTQQRVRGLPVALALLSLVPVQYTFAAADGHAILEETQNQDRVTNTRQFAGGSDESAAKPTVEKSGGDAYAPLEKGGERGKTASGTQSHSLAYDFWFYDADVALFLDEDNDGFYTGIDLNFDIDTIWSTAEIYVAVYLSLEGGPWNEYAVSDDFTIHDTSGSDDYTLVTELVSGYPTGDYDLLIEVFDAFTGDFLASYGPEDTSELAYLPLEDFSADTPPTVVERRVTVTREGGGSFSFWALFSILLLLAARTVVRRS